MRNKREAHGFDENYDASEEDEDEPDDEEGSDVADSEAARGARLYPRDRLHPYRRVAHSGFGHSVTAVSGSTPVPGRDSPSVSASPSTRPSTDEELKTEEDGHGDQDVTGAIGVPSVEPAGETSDDQKGSESGMPAPNSDYWVPASDRQPSRSYGRYMRDLFRDHICIDHREKAEEPSDNWFSQEYVGKWNREQPLHLVYSDETDMSLMMSDEEVEIWIASDSGAVDHVCGRGHIPASFVFRQPSDGKLARNFTSASGGSIKNHGAAEVNLATEEGTTTSITFQVAGVC